MLLENMGLETESSGSQAVLLMTSSLQTCASTS